MSSEQHFRSQIDEWISVSIARGVSSFSDLIRDLPGVFPAEVVQSLQRLKVLGAKDIDHLLPLASANLSQSVSYPCDWLPVPHPLDFDWRFDEQTIDILLDVANRLRKPPLNIAILGAPSLVPSFVNRFRESKLNVFDNNPLVHGRIRSLFPNVSSLNVDLLRVLPSNLPEFNLVIADPPWYHDHMCSFLWTANRLCQVGGIVLASVPSKGTRPNAEADVERLLGYAKFLGLLVTEIQPGYLRYVSPYFEQNAIRATKIGNVPLDWRASDLVQFECVKKTATPRTIVSKPEKWVEVSLGTVRVKLRKKRSTSSDPRLISIVDEDILDTVSQRDVRIDSVDVWTSGNRVFACDSTEKLLEIMLGIANDGAKLKFNGNDENAIQIRTVYSQLSRVVAAETAWM